MLNTGRRGDTLPIAMTTEEAGGPILKINSPNQVKIRYFVSVEAAAAL